LKKALNQKAETNCKFDWFINSHTESHFGKYFKNIHKIFDELNGDLFANQNKRISNLRCDAYFGGKYNLIFEFDEFQHFSSTRLATLNKYPKHIQLNFLTSVWRKYCLDNLQKADRYRYSKTTVDFNFEGGPNGIETGPYISSTFENPEEFDKSIAELNKQIKKGEFKSGNVDISKYSRNK
jgi:hypothetical protein